jgi:hypothetical protein
VVPVLTTPTVAPATMRATTKAIQEMMKKAKDLISDGKWIMSSDTLLKTLLKEFLFGARLRSLNWNEMLAFSHDIKKQQKSKMKTSPFSLKAISLHKPYGNPSLYLIE